MSQWEYERGRNACLQNMAHGDFSNHLGAIFPANRGEEEYWRDWAVRRLAKLGIPVEERPDTSWVELARR